MTILLVLLLTGGAVTFPAIRQSFTPGETDDGKFVTEIVKRGPFRIAVTERGTLDSLKNSTLTNSVEGTTTIISIVPEGTIVEEGDIVCELDSSSLVEKEKQQQISVTQSEADLKKSEENIEIQKRQNESDIAAARLAQDLAKLDLEKFREGESIQQENEIRGEITVAQEEYARALENYDFSKRLAKKGYKSQNDLEADRIAVTKALIKLSVAKDKLKVLKDFTYKRTIKELEENAAETVRQLSRVILQGTATLAQYNADYKASKLTYEVEFAKLDLYRKQIAACKLRAPQPGEVIYANLHSRRNEAAIIEEGATVRERQAIIKLPDLTQMKVDAKIHESRISMVHKGLPVSIRIDAYADVPYHGVVESVSSVPVSSSWMRPDLKEYEAVIRITDEIGDVRKLKPGLTAEIEILVGQYDDVRQVPIQSVVSVGEKYVSFVQTPQGPQRRNVLIGKANDKAIEILDGLKAGERVILNPRTHFSDELAELEAAFAKSSAEKTSNPNGQTRQRAETPHGSATGRENRPKPDGSGQPARDPAAFFKKIDQNGDGKLAKDEVPAGMQAAFDTMDSNGDGLIDIAEFKKRAAQSGRGNRSGGRPGGQPR